ncbi:hypothetical protein C8J56DRAFT_1007467 [Mycena floridula]|nr:hypothetical protein C8J56DRAFT_1007467 [Mycena floridula]
MPLCQVPPAIKACIPILHLEQHYDIQEICTILGIKKSLVYKTLALYDKLGVTTQPKTLYVQFICHLLQKNPCTYLDEIQSDLEHQRGVIISIPTLLQTLQRLQFSNKTVSIQALEHNDLQRSAFMNCIAEIMLNPDMVMFINEAAKNDKTVARNDGWSFIGTRVIQRQVFV